MVPGQKPSRASYDKTFVNPQPQTSCCVDDLPVYWNSRLVGPDGRTSYRHRDCCSLFMSLMSVSKGKGEEDGKWVKEGKREFDLRAQVTAHFNLLVSNEVGSLIESSSEKPLISG